MIRPRLALPARPSQPSGAAAVEPARRTRRWAWLGGLLGGLAGLLAFAPASWLAEVVADSSGGRLLLAEAQGTVWQGSALLVLTGGPGSRDASVLPSRLSWALRPDGLGLQLQLRQDCCIPSVVRVRWQPRPSGSRVAVAADEGELLGEWPAAWLAGLGAPLNTLQPEGALRIKTQGLTLQGDGRSGWRMLGRADLELLRLSSRLSTLAPLGSYRLSLQGAADAGQPLPVQLSTLEGALQLQASGHIGPRGLRLRGEARAAPGQEAPLNNLLNIIGRRQGAASLLSIG